MTRARIASNGLRCSRVTIPLRFRAVGGSVGARLTAGLYRSTRSPRSGQILQLASFGPSMAPAGPPWEVYNDGGVMGAQKGF